MTSPSQEKTSDAPGVEQRVVDAMVRAGVGLAVYLPDSVLLGLVRAIERDGRIPTLLCAREDEGVAIATGASLAGTLSVVLMEGSGLGFSGLILARAMLQRSTFLLIGSHTRALGEAFDFHAATRIAGAATLEGLHIPYEIPRSADELVTLTGQLLETSRGQREITAMLVPPFVLRGAA